MPLTEEQRQELLQEIKITRDKLADIPDRLEAVETSAKDTADKSEHTRWAVVIVAIVGIIGGLFFVWQDNRQTDDILQKFNEFAFCQAEYNRVNAEGTQMRSTIAARDRVNTQSLVIGVGQIVATGEGNLQQVFNKYNRELAKIDAARKANPVLEYPDCYSKYISTESPDGEK